jgi:hypothetical protein
VEGQALLPYPGIGHMHSVLFLLFFGFFSLVISIVVIFPYWFIFKKAGFSGFLALLMFVPFINIIMLYFLAFARWNVVPATAVYPAPPVPYRPPV